MKKETDLKFYKRYTPNGLIDDRPITSSTRLILREAKNLGMEIKHLIGTNVFKLKYRGEEKDFHFQNPSCNSATGMYIANSKRATRNLLQNNKICIPTGYALKMSDSSNQKKEVYDSLKIPSFPHPFRS